MARPTIEPVTDANIDELCAFLHEHLNPEITPQGWRVALTHSWHMQSPNHGFMLRDAGRIVGGIGALYAERRIDGRTVRSCNITSWCVLEAYRQQSMRLAMAVVGQKDYVYTDFSPTQVVGSMLRFLKFQPLDERQAVLVNLPWPSAALPPFPHVLQRPSDIEAALEGPQLDHYRDHAGYPWLRHLAVGRPGDWCHVIYKPRTLRRLPAADVIHVGDPESFDRYWRRLAAHLLARGFAFTLLEARRLRRLPWPTRIRSGFNAKLVAGDALRPEQVDLLYSEAVALDL